jgi:hypothetical protein
LARRRKKGLNRAELNLTRIRIKELNHPSPGARRKLTSLKVVCFVRKVNNISNIKMNLSKQVSTRGQLFLTFYFRAELSTVDLLIKVACFLTKGNNIFNIKMN